MYRLTRCWLPSMPWKLRREAPPSSRIPSSPPILESFGDGRRSPTIHYLAGRIIGDLDDAIESEMPGRGWWC